MPSAEAAAKISGEPGQVARALMEPQWVPEGLVHVGLREGPDQTRTVWSTEPLMRVSGCVGRKRTALTRSAWPLRVAWTPRWEGSCRCVRGAYTRETRRGGARTRGFQRAMQRPAPNARRPEEDQSAAEGWRLAPMEMKGVETVAIGGEAGVAGGLGGGE